MLVVVPWRQGARAHGPRQKRQRAGAGGLRHTRLCASAVCSATGTCCAPMQQQQQVAHNVSNAAVEGSLRFVPVCLVLGDHAASNPHHRCTSSMTEERPPRLKRREPGGSPLSSMSSMGGQWRMHASDHMQRRASYCQGREWWKRRTWTLAALCSADFGGCVPAVRRPGWRVSCGGSCCTTVWRQKSSAPAWYPRLQDFHPTLTVMQYKLRYECMCVCARARECMHACT